MRSVIAAVVWVGTWAISLLVSSAHAHDPGLSTADAEFRTESFRLVTGFAPADVQQLLPLPLRRGDKWEQSDFEAVQRELIDLAPSLWEARSAGVEMKLVAVDVQLLPGDNVSFTHDYTPVTDRDGVTLRALKLPDLPAGHRQFVIVNDARGSAVAKKLLSAKDNVLKVHPTIGMRGAESHSRPPETQTFWSFLKLGVEHIWTGYDHLLFLFGLLVVCRRFRSSVVIITCFTLAHSLTLALATLDWVTLPARWVEVAIAATIVFVGLENLWRRGQEPRGRWALTFAFGLIHGFGFASVLRDLGVGGRGDNDAILMPLFAFNFGVELGQIAIAAVALPFIWRLRRNPKFVGFGVPALSACVAAAGLYWLLERTAFS